MKEEQAPNTAGRKPVWVPPVEWKKRANITRFIDFVNRTTGQNIDSYAGLYKWSVESIPQFWAAVWDFVEIKASRKYDKVIDDLAMFPGANWFPGARLNFAQNLLRFRDERPAFIFRGENQKAATMTYAELYTSVARLSKALRDMGVVAGDRVGAYMPNLMETAIAMLAVTSIGAIWSSCGTELGARAVADRLGQIGPKVLFTVDAQFYKGKTVDVLASVEKIAEQIPTLERIIVTPYVEERPAIGNLPNAVLFADFLSKDAPEIQFEQLPFNHPVYIMFSSGTTGKPKCMVQGPGVLINQLKELIIQTDLKSEDRIFYITSPSWMMWNWLIGSLAAGATIVLYDGNPNYPDWGAMWRLAQDEKITIFGCSASYLNYLRSAGASPGKTFDLSALRAMSQTGSPLSADGFEYVYSEIKQEMHFNSIAGGTDINGCFALGTMIQPVYAGELQGPGLGMKIKAYDESGKHVTDKEGELVCEAPTPSMPLYFWNDNDFAKYRSAYFDVYPGIWRHGDWVLFHSDSGGVTFLGRSDFTLKPSGVRIGPAEIYNVVENIAGIADCMAVGQDWKGEQRVILFVRLATGYELTEELKNQIKTALRKQASPRHVPNLIVEAPDIPYTFNMKKVESSVANILNGRPVTNADALTNPESLAFYETIAAELLK
ncbi:Acetyl-coenzyme A synthetase 1 [Syntrophobacter sp. SbD1]|nr:Acetyl-coenzyme A synthetase 1 [Syntrophobacter sp. SbD1]